MHLASALTDLLQTHLSDHGIGVEILQTHELNTLTVMIHDLDEHAGAVLANHKETSNAFLMACKLHD